MTSTTPPRQRTTSSTTHDLVAVNGSTLTIRDLSVSHPETVALARAELNSRGPAVLADTIRRAITVGLLASTTADAGADATATLSATLSGLSADVEATARRTLTGLEELLEQLDAGRQATASAAATTLAELPDRLERALAGEAGTVRDAVRRSVQEVHDRALRELGHALHEHSEAMRTTLSTENPSGPVHQLRRDLSQALEATRSELSAGLATVQAQIAAQQAAANTRARASTVKGTAWEERVVDAVAACCTASGDMWAATGTTPATGGTSKSGDVLIRVHGPQVPDGLRIAIEAKNRARPWSMRELAALVTATRQARQALGCIIVVPDPEHLPAGSGRLLRVDGTAWAVAADSQDVLLLVLAVVRELVLAAALGAEQTETDLTAVRVELQHAVEALTRFDDLTRSSGLARRHLDDVTKIADGIRAALHGHLARAGKLLRS